MTLFTSRVTIVVLTLLLPAAADIISDITISESDETSALQVKAELFWQPILSAAKDVQMEEHLDLYEDAETAIKQLPAENEYVRQALREALDHLKSADDAAFKQALASSSTAQHKLEVPCDTGASGFSFLKGGQDYFRSALKRFTGGDNGGHYPEKLLKHVEQRQADILPVLQGAAGSAGNILSDCRLASKRSFDVRKYDIYNKGVPKTPQFADDMADRIIDAAGKTRHRFMAGINELVKGITRDVQERQEDPAATVTKASLKGLHMKVAQAEAGFAKKPLLSSSVQEKIADGKRVHWREIISDL